MISKLHCLISNCTVTDDIVTIRPLSLGNDKKRDSKKYPYKNSPSFFKNSPSFFLGPSFPLFRPFYLSFPERDRECVRESKDDTCKPKRNQEKVEGLRRQED